MTNYICINGKKAELTEEQMKALGIEVPKANPFERQPKTKPFYFITNKGKVEYGVEIKDFHCQGLYDAANYCTDKAILEQRSLHEILNRLLWRYSMEHKRDTHEKSEAGQDVFYSIAHYATDLFNDRDRFCVNAQCRGFGLEVYFDAKEIAEAAIKEIVEPFMKAHPEFKF